MTRAVLIELEMPESLSRFRLPCGVQDRLHDLLDRQGRGESLSTAEHREAEGLVDLGEMLRLLELCVRRAPSTRTTMRDLLGWIRSVEMDDPSFAEDLEEILGEQPPVGHGPWDS